MMQSMYDPTIHAQTLARQLRPDDFVAQPLLHNPVHRGQTLATAAQIGEKGFTSLALRRNLLRSKPVYGLTDIGELLVTRHITENIRRITGVKQDDRKFIVECIATLSKEGVPFRLYKFDIKSFYESVNTLDLCATLESDVAFSGQSARVLRSFIAELDKAGASGLPRGLAISATLAEYLMRDFDDFVANTHRVLYYSRFVDDICVITDATEDTKEFTRLLSDTLPKGLTFNEKSEPFSFLKYSKGVPPSVEHSINYLGYCIHISSCFRPTKESPIERDVWLDINAAKVKRIKSRLVASYLQFNRDGIYDDLRDRIRILTGNFSLKDRSSGARRIAGIRFNYPLVDSRRSRSLPELDRFLRNSLMSSSPKNRARPKVTAPQRAELSRYTFRNGFNRKVFFHFSPQRLAFLTNCWAYV
jgi:hypothetical protein